MSKKLKKQEQEKLEQENLEQENLEEETNVVPEHIDKDQFEFVQIDHKIFDSKFETKPVGYWKDAFRRFARSTSSVICFFLLAIIVLLSIVGEVISPYDASTMNQRAGYLPPRVPGLEHIGIMDGTTKKKGVLLNQIMFKTEEEKARFYKEFDKVFTSEIINDTEHYQPIPYDEVAASDPVISLRKFDSRFIDSIKNIKVVHKMEWKRDPITGEVLTDENGDYIKVDNYYYTADIKFNMYKSLGQLKKSQGDIDLVLTNLAKYEGITQENWEKDALLDQLKNWRDAEGNPLKKGKPNTEIANDLNSRLMTELGVENIDDLSFRFTSILRTNRGYEFIFEANALLTGNTGPKSYHIFGTDNLGRDMWCRIWSGLGISMLIGLAVGVFCIAFGICWGSISGFYGGIVDICMERFTDILVNIPSIIILTLLKLYLGDEHSLIVFILTLVMTSWVGMSSRTRIQFYRYKNREYVLAARTLGAKDGRLIFKHILPNGIGPLVNMGVSIIPASMNFETSIAYLGLATATANSIGTIISAGNENFLDFPYLLVIPSLIYAVIMVSFNVLGLGLRDALNPSLRGS